jgi:hypothetical protein
MTLVLTFLHMYQQWDLRAHYCAKMNPGHVDFLLSENTTDRLGQALMVLLVHAKV